MGSVKEILDREPPPVLYHYTTQGGLLGIIGIREIWASHCQYLNDEQEFAHALGIAQDVLLNMKMFPPHQARANIVEEMEAALRDRELTRGTVNVCVCSFSEASDVLSQWRAYGGGSAGFSLGFSGPFLKAVAREQDFWLVPCIYDPGLQRELMRNLLNDVFNENADPSRSWPNRPAGGNLIEYLNRYAPILKHGSFAEEREWRIITKPLDCKQDGFGYRPGGSMLIPYYRTRLATQATPFELSEVVIGPTPHPELSERSLRAMLHLSNLGATVVRRSSAPYRNW
jgi:hypothetical protein